MVMLITYHHTMVHGTATATMVSAAHPTVVHVCVVCTAVIHLTMTAITVIHVTVIYQ